MKRYSDMSGLWHMVRNPKKPKVTYLAYEHTLHLRICSFNSPKTQWPELNWAYKQTIKLFLNNWLHGCSSNTVGETVELRFWIQVARWPWCGRRVDKMLIKPLFYGQFYLAEGALGVLLHGTSWLYYMIPVSFGLAKYIYSDWLAWQTAISADEEIFRYEWPMAYGTQS